MIDVELFHGQKPIPTICENIHITIDGKLFDSDTELTLDQFNARTSLDVKDIAVLVAVTYQKFNWPPAYWKHLKALRSIPDVDTPESLVLAIDAPVESLEFPGFYMIPYFSNYVISPQGRLIRRLLNLEIQASEGSLGYRTYRMMGDDGGTQNQLRHRILCLTFKPYPAHVDDLDVNHKDGVPGNDSLDNLEWCTRSENMEHAYALGLRSDNKPVEMRDINTGKVFIFPSCSFAGRILKVTETTISNRAKTQGYKTYGGFQFRFHPNHDPWPEFENSQGKYLVEFPDGSNKRCDCDEAARLAGLTRTSLLRALREGRAYGTTRNKITRL